MTHYEKYCGKNNTVTILSQLTLRMELIKADAIKQLKGAVADWRWKERKCAL
jgi:hypothetical protein